MAKMWPIAGTQESHKFCPIAGWYWVKEVAVEVAFRLIVHFLLSGETYCTHNTMCLFLANVG